VLILITLYMKHTDPHKCTNAMQQHLKGKRLYQKCADMYMDFHYTHKLDLNGTQKVTQNI